MIRCVVRATIAVTACGIFMLTALWASNYGENNRCSWLAEHQRGNTANTVYQCDRR